jgi:hypothetical protein
MPVENGETAVILIVVLVIFLFGGFSRNCFSWVDFDLTGEMSVLSG